MPGGAGRFERTFMPSQPSPAALLDLPADADPLLYPSTPSPSPISVLVPVSDAPRPAFLYPEPGTLGARISGVNAPSIRVEEAINIDYCERRNRLLWEGATFTLQAILVEQRGDERRYGPHDPWTEPTPDPRTAYRSVGNALVRRAIPGGDYDERRHVTGFV